MTTTYSLHAAQRIARRGIKAEWVEQAIAAPSWTRANRDDATVTLSFREIVEFGGRILRVAHRDEHVLTAYFDRGAKP